jgi:hypothetical protein
MKSPVVFGGNFKIILLITPDHQRDPGRHAREGVLAQPGSRTGRIYYAKDQLLVIGCGEPSPQISDSSLFKASFLEDSSQDSSPSPK